MECHSADDDNDSLQVTVTNNCQPAGFEMWTTMQQPMALRCGVNFSWCFELKFCLLFLGPRSHLLDTANLKLFSKRKCVFNDIEVTHISRQFHVIFDHWFCRFYISKTDIRNYNIRLNKRVWKNVSIPLVLEADIKLSYGKTAASSWPVRKIKAAYSCNFGINLQENRVSHSGRPQWINE